jgi:transcription elongation GreA/GreB family factor
MGMAKNKQQWQWFVFDEDEEATEESGERHAVRLLRAARSGNWSVVDEIWLELPSARPEPAAEFFHFFAETRKRRGSADVAGYVELLLGVNLDEAFAPAALEIALFAAPHLDEGAERAREPLLRAARRALGDAGDALTRAARLSEPSSDAAESVREMAKLARLRPGAVFKHQFYAAGLVTAVDYDARRLSMDFPGTPYSAIPVKFEHVDELLTPLPPSHFDVLRLASPDRARQMANDNPAALVKRVASARGGRVSQADLKNILAANVMTEAEFKNWWGKRRAEVVRDPFLDVEGKGAHCVFALRTDPKPFHEELSRDFAQAQTFAERLEIVRSVVRAARDGAFPERGFATFLPSFQKAAIESAKLSPSDRLAWTLLGRQLEAAGPAGFKVPAACDPREELKKAARPGAAIAGLESPDLMLAALDELKAAFPSDWAKRMAEVVRTAPPRVIERSIADLNAAGEADAASRLLGHLISHPERNPEGYLWVMKGLLDGEFKGAAVGLDRAHLIEDLLKECERLRRAPTTTKEEEKRNRDLSGKIAKFLGERQHKRVAEMVAEMSVADARAFYESLPKRKLDEAFLSELRLSLRKTRNDLEGDGGAAPGAAPSADIVWLCLEETRRKKLAEFSKLLNEEIPANSAAIGAARELGDLRENAEYQTAKDYQKVLFARRDELQEQLAKARSVEPNQVRPDAIRFGTRFTVADAKGGKERVYTLLGPWESDPDKGVISYLAPLGQSFQGKKVGDRVKVDMPGGGASEYTVKKIENGLA